MEEVSINQAMQIALQHHRAGRLQQAEQICRLILAKKPDHPDALNLYAVLAFKAGRSDIALELVRRAIAVNPSSAEFHSNLGNLLRAVGQATQAIDAYRNAIEIDPQLAEVHNNLGSAFTDLGQLDRAIASHETAIGLNPKLFQAHSNLGNAFTDLGQLDNAITAYSTALSLSPDHAEVRSNLAMCLLLKGDYPAGWSAYEWRLKSGREPQLSQPLWDGSDLNGRTILLRAEQGFGDTIQFIRYVPLVAGRGGRVVVECQPELIPLLNQLPLVVEWVAIGQALPHYDVWRPLLSLPLIFGTTVSNIPEMHPPLRAVPDRVEDWRIRLAVEPTKLKIGLVWAGRPEHKNDRNRSIPFSMLADLANVVNTQFVSLQKGLGAARAKSLELIDLTEHLNDFADTAALIANLDLVISVDTAVAHLAGAMDKPVWLLVPFAPDWRWLTERSDSPWYPTMRLFRQTRIGDWQSVIRQIASELRQESSRSVFQRTLGNSVRFR